MEYNNNHIIRTHFFTDMQFYRSRKNVVSLLVSNISFFVSANEPASASDLLHFITREFNAESFSVTIQLDEQTTPLASKIWISALIVLLADVRYSKFRGKEFVFVEVTQNGRFALKWLTHLESQLKALGFNNVILHRIKGDINNGIELIDISTIAGLNKDQLLLEKNLETQLYFRATDGEKYQAQVMHLESLLSAIDKLTGELIKDKHQLRLHLEERNAYISYLEGSVQSKSEYLSFLLRPVGNGIVEEASPGMISDLQKIKNFYHHEYEILPLWYKRFGHLLKVIMGKRKLRSLFNDNTKKYK